MINNLFFYLDHLDNFLWGYAALPAIMLLGTYLSFKSRFVQIRKFPEIVMTFVGFLTHKNQDNTGVHPLKAFFACVGGCTGIGNVVAICTAAQIGGPGALFWIWVTAIVGMIIKYSEVYLGVRYRVSNGKGGYHGGPMYYLQRVFKGSWVPKIVCILLCIYGVEIYQFSVITNSITANIEVDKTLVVLVLLGLVIGASSGGVQRVGKICGMMIPVFLICYVGMGAWVLIQNMQQIPGVFSAIFNSAFSGHAATGAFAGSGIMLTVSQGIRRGCYAGDVGVGYASVIHSETGETKPEKQASLAIFDIFVDSFMICTTSVLIVLVTGVWKEPMDASLLIQTALGKHFPFMEVFMPLFLFLLGYTTIIAYFCAGIKCAEFLHPGKGKKIYYLYAATALVLFSFVSTYEALIIMSITGGLLLVINLYGIYRLRHDLAFPDTKPQEAACITVPNPDFS